MSRSTDEAVTEYISSQMPARVKKALAKAKFNLFYGAAEPGEDIGGTWGKSSRIVEEWMDEHSDDLVVDDAGNVSTRHEFDKWLRQVGDEEEERALQEAIDEGLDNTDESWSVDGTEAERQARRAAHAYVDSELERSTAYDSSDVRRLVLGKDWP